MTEPTPKPNPSEVATRAANSGGLLDATFQHLAPEQRQRLAEKAIEKKLELDVQAIQAAQRHERSSADMHNTVRHIGELERSTKSDYTVRATFETASGNTSVEVKKSNNTTIIVVAVVIAVIFLILFAR